MDCLKKVVVGSVAVMASAVLIPSIANAASILEWNTAGNLGTETTEPSTLNDPGVATSNLTLGAGVTPAANGNRFGGSNWFDTGDSQPQTLAQAVTGNDYIQFVLTPQAGNTVSLTGFSFIWGRSGTGPDALTLRSSADSFTADLATATGLVDTTTVVTNLTFTLNNITTATTFRLYGYGGTATAATGGTGGFDTATAATTPNVILSGTVVPEPSALALIGVAGLLAGRRRLRNA
ncbi:PEP-CTERM sorting domain-containing protein [Humisphaera borealis]|uniref:PEP-CTERM sorting domain-containing protein n=1 Tax=Humisphaera borealis TaxID=2807512 RepID=A0A7M2X1S2_9BACT|nr:PEP-CTERM sorting domain-containing protein [Humisphaera borealis]QOV91707.1 PEP-CTERM sorting domain-containing protein [Humisphaera borealis]